MNVCMQQIADNAQQVDSKWREVFNESEDFEALAIVRVEGLLKDAHAHKKNLESQKQALIARLRRVTNILEKSDGKHSHDNS